MAVLEDLEDFKSYNQSFFNLGRIDIMSFYNTIVNDFLAMYDAYA